MGFLPRKYSTQVLRHEMVCTVQRHHLDFGSMESRIASMTSIIRNWQELYEQFPRNKRLNVRLKELIDKRKKFLKYLRRWDYKRYEWLLDKLDVVYHPPPNEYRRMYSSPMASLVLTDSSQLTAKSFEKLPDQVMYPYAEPYDLQKHLVLFAVVMLGCIALIYGNPRPRNFPIANPMRVALALVPGSPIYSSPMASLVLTDSS
uniref:Small ribosomal subunit protein uS15m n=1 Tax=Timema shepardi TaxID=629360 RepID=A0A7R9B2I7_TIMSH|nr:unnamed protein product [Timema shepardi]